MNNTTATFIGNETMASAINFAITSIDDIIGEAGYEGLPETKQENLHKAVSLLQNIKYTQLLEEAYEKVLHDKGHQSIEELTKEIDVTCPPSNPILLS